MAGASTLLQASRSDRSCLNRLGRRSGGMEGRPACLRRERRPPVNDPLGRTYVPGAAAQPLRPGILIGCRRHVKTDPVSECRRWVNFRVPLTSARTCRSRYTAFSSRRRPRHSFTEHARRQARLALAVCRGNGWQPESLGGDGTLGRLFEGSRYFLYASAIAAVGQAVGDLDAFFAAYPSSTPQASPRPVAGKAIQFDPTGPERALAVRSGRWLFRSSAEARRARRFGAQR
jgi:hypothetical protein